MKGSKTIPLRDRYFMFEKMDWKASRGFPFLVSVSILATTADQT